jgi:hypothetical protein
MLAIMSAAGPCSMSYVNAASTTNPQYPVDANVTRPPLLELNGADALLPNTRALHTNPLPPENASVPPDRTNIILNTAEVVEYAESTVRVCVFATIMVSLTPNVSFVRTVSCVVVTVVALAVPKNNPSDTKIETRYFTTSTFPHV